MRYNPEAQYVPGKQLVVADTLSPAPQPGEVSEIEWEIAADIAAIEQGRLLTSHRQSLIQEATQEDEELSAVFRYSDSGWPSHASFVAPIAQPYYSVRGLLSIHDGLITYDDHLIFPRCLRADVLQKIHEGHQGITKCRERAHQSVWWPKTGEEIVQIVQQCAHCQKHKKTTAKEPMVPKVLPHIRAFRYSRSSSVRQRTTVQFERISTICGFIRFHTLDLKSILSAGERSVRASRSGRQNIFATIRSYVNTASISLNATRVNWV